jgi:pimeloyl-ACP methyl ester carboxylesterase
MTSTREELSMTTTATTEMTHVVSADGTRIAVFISGGGRPLVVVPGTTSDHTTWRLVLPMLAGHVQVHAVDRRGRGASGDSADYSLDREYADVAAVVDAAATAAGEPVDLMGHSYGGNVAFGAASRTTNIRKLILYEGWPAPDVADRTFPAEVMARLETMISEGRHEEMLLTFYRDIVQMSDVEIDGIKAAPTWPARVAAAPTVPRECRAFGAQAFDPRWAAQITAPVLLLVGEHSPDAIKADPDLVAAALPDARIRILKGQMHMAHLTDPENFAATVLTFLTE